MVEFQKMPDPDASKQDELDRVLRSALRPIPAPEGFADRVLARAEESPADGSSAFRRRPGFHPLLRWSIAAVLLLAIGIGGFTAHQRERRVAGERARDQVLLALRITSFTIRAMRDQAGTDKHHHREQQETP
jgi:hypothetical protein